MKKRILFILPSFGIGGTTVSTRNLIAVLDKQHYEVTVWALSDYGILKGMYDDIDKVKTCFTAQALALGGWKEECNWLRCLAAAILRFARNHSLIIEEVLVKHAIKKSIGNKHFDAIVACQEGFATLLASCCEATNKLAWVRCDYKEYLKSHCGQKERFYAKFNHIVCVAEKTTINFKEIYPEYEDRTLCIYNAQDSELIRKQALVDDHDSNFISTKPIILSVGRFSSVKRFVEIPKIARVIKQQGIDFTWYVIGEGEERTKIQKAIVENDINDNVVLLGAKSNPHFYISKSDLYVCLSSTEACPRVINEAKILGTPVVSTDFDTVFEYIESGENGIVCPIENLPDEICKILTDRQLYNHIKSNISTFEFDNKEIIEKIESIL